VPWPAPGPYAPPPYGAAPPPGYGQGYGYGYGQDYGYPPYPGPPQGWYAHERTTNGLAIASLVTSFTCIPLLGTVLGVLGLRQIRRRPQRGRGLALAGLLINGLATIATALLVVLGLATDVFDQGNTKVADLKAGQCFNTVGHSLSDYQAGDVPSARVNVVPCDSAHDAEAFATVPIGDQLGSAFPGFDRISRYAGPRCGGSADDYLDGATLPDGVALFYYMPPRAGWDAGRRTVTCFFGGVTNRITGSVRGGHDAGLGA
jgi:hypothetical protein